MKQNNRNRIPTGHFALRPGSRAKVKSVFGGYALPDGLNEGDEVTVISWDIGRYQIEKDGRTFSISCTNVAR